MKKVTNMRDFLEQQETEKMAEEIIKSYRNDEIQRRSKQQKPHSQWLTKYRQFIFDAFLMTSGAYFWADKFFQWVMYG